MNTHLFLLVTWDPHEAVQVLSLHRTLEGAISASENWLKREGYQWDRDRPEWLFQNPGQTDLWERAMKRVAYESAKEIDGFTLSGSYHLCQIQKWEISL